MTRRQRAVHVWVWALLLPGLVMGVVLLWVHRP
jgi:hypothetical protein